MARWILYLLLGACLTITSIGASRSAAQAGPTPFAATANPPRRSPRYPYPLLILTLEDDGGTFRVPVNAQIVLQIPHTPRARLVYDPSILQMLTGVPLDPAYTLPWYFRAIRPGSTILGVEPEPCDIIPCPKMPSIPFRVTLVVSDNLPPLPPTPLPPLPPPVIPPKMPETYIGTAYLNQTIRVQVGQFVVLDLPSLDMRGPVQVQFDPAMLRPLPGQALTYPQPGGWRFQVVQPGTSVLTVQANGCPGGGSDCPPTIWFQVTLTTAP